MWTVSPNINLYLTTTDCADCNVNVVSHMRTMVLEYVPTFGPKNHLVLKVSNYPHHGANGFHYIATICSQLFNQSSRIFFYGIVNLDILCSFINPIYLYIIILYIYIPFMESSNLWDFYLLEQLAIYGILFR